MTTVCTTFLFVSDNAFGLSAEVGYVIAAATCIVSATLFFVWYTTKGKYQEEAR